VLFAHGSGSSRHSPRNQSVAGVLHDAGMRTVLIDLLTEREEREDQQTREHRFDIDLLSERVGGAVSWLREQPEMAGDPIGVLGASTGAAAALVAAADLPRDVSAVVSRGGRPDLAGDALTRVQAPALLIVGGNDSVVERLNREAMTRMTSETRLEIVPGASHLFEEPGALDQVARLASDWFRTTLAGRTTTSSQRPGRTPPG